MKNVVYHSSSISDLKEIMPRVGTHGEPWVYAVSNKAMSAIFLAHGGDMMLGSGMRDGKPFLCERFQGAFDLVYGGKSGSIYHLSGDNFESGKTSFKAEVVSSQIEKVLFEEHIVDTKAYLLSLIADEKIDMFYYPHRPAHIPNDDQDLVDKTVHWVRQFGSDRMKNLVKYHPHLVERVTSALGEVNDSI